MRDLTHLKTYIIDSKNPKEVDDAFSLEKIEGDVKKLWIHISNPCKIFTFDSKIDLYARKKSSSIYLIEDYIPMLPLEIIEKANLKENKVSETISASVIFNNDGSIYKYEIVEAKIRPKYQLTYDDADEIIEIEPKEESEIIDIKSLLLKSNDFRKKKGAIIFDIPTNKIDIINGNVEITTDEKTTAQLIVAESMIIMGYVTSLYLTENNISAPFRTQRINCDAFDILEKYKDSEIKYSILKQYMGKSFINTKANVHETLGLDKYTQCTSPLRRYLDLITQRQIFNHINNSKLLNSNKITEIIDYARIRQLEINNIYKNDKIKYLSIFFIKQNKTLYKIIFVKWINFKKNIALVYFPKYSLEILIILYSSIEIYSNKTYKVKFNSSDKNILEFVH